MRKETQTRPSCFSNRMGSRRRCKHNLQTKNHIISFLARFQVGLVAEMQTRDEQLEIAGTLQQKISSCLSVLDRFLNQKEPVVSSIVVAEKQTGLAADNIIEAIANIIGIRDIKTVSPYSTMSELGMDSMMSVEVKQMMERECQIFLPPAEIRSLTFTR